MNNKATLDKWVFVPGYYQGKTPWGIYVGKQAFTHYDFDVYEDGDRNYAFVTVYNGLKAPHDGPAFGGKTPKGIDGGDGWEDLGGWVEVSKDVYDDYYGFDTFIGDTFKFNWKGKTHYFIWKFVDAGRLGDNVGGQGLAYNGNKRYDTSVSPYFDGETFGVYKAAANLWSGSIA
ncbi:hypothetical protein [Herbidospora cretacea]|uniref:hypothetical protein n=1 Tax=Herbidospora cretacea TaxID=28444 RepID=UPI00068CB089|nr:hypothetical protein [Herbidospora cretacea]